MSDEEREEKELDLTASEVVTKTNPQLKLLTLHTQQGPVTGRAADVIAAAYTVADVALRLVGPGNKNKDVIEAIQKVAAVY